MEQHLKKRAALAWILGGTLFMMAFGAPLTGAAASYFWTHHVVDARSDDEVAAIRLRAAVAQPGIWVGLGGTLSRYARLSDCAKNASKSRSSQMLEPVTPLAGIFWDIDESLQSRDDETRDRVALAAYLNLPGPILGALDGCIAASMLAALCTRYARGMVDDYLLSHINEIRAADLAKTPPAVKSINGPSK